MMSIQAASLSFTRHVQHAKKLALVTLISALLPLSALAVDTDHDGLPDDWETAHGRDPAKADYALSISQSSYNNSSYSIQTQYDGVACTISGTGVNCIGSDNQVVYNEPTSLSRPYALYTNFSQPNLSGAGVACVLSGTAIKNCWGFGAPPASFTPEYPQGIDNLNRRIVQCTNTSGYPYQSTNETQLTCSVTSTKQISCQTRYLSNYAQANNSPSCPSSTTTTTPAVYTTKGTISYIDGNSVMGVCALTEFGPECFGGSAVMPGTFDPDSDGVAGLADALPLDASETLDSDGDGIGNNTETDDDNDSVLDESDNCPLNSNANQLNTDGDSQGNACDSDDDNDGVLDTSDKFPLNPAASADTDADGFPNSWNVACDTACQSNAGLLLDNCPLNNNPNQLNTDADAQGDICDSDDDNDGVADTADKFPLDVTEAIDTDLDGIGNNADLDDDDDSVTDSGDAFPLLPGASADTDHDGMPDAITVSLPQNFETGTFTGSPWVMGGNSSWAITSSTKHAGTYSACSGAIGINQTSSIQITVNTASTFSFWALASMAYGDDFRFFVDGVAIAYQYGTGYSSSSWGGGSPFKKVSPGTHVFKWLYTRNNMSGGPPNQSGNYVCIDDINFGSGALIEDTDDDNDSVADASDALPLDANESIDTDHDGIGNNADTDDDGDHVPDALDADPLNPSIDTMPVNGVYKGSGLQEAQVVQ